MSVFNLFIAVLFFIRRAVLLGTSNVQELIDRRLPVERPAVVFLARQRGYFPRVASSTMAISSGVRS